MSINGFNDLLKKGDFTRKIRVCFAFWGRLNNYLRSGIFPFFPNPLNLLPLPALSLNLASFGVLGYFHPLLYNRRLARL